MSLLFAPVDDGDPVTGLFFVEARPYPVRDVGERATGMCFLVSSEGLVVTCAHVLLAVGRLPGEKATLYGAGPGLPIAVEAEVLTEGWRGPDWRKWIGRAAQGHDLTPFVDRRPDLFQEDMALLRILPETARWDMSRGQPLEGDPQATLRATARALPLGVPGYRYHSGTPLQSWHVYYERKAPSLRPADASFRGAEPELHGVIRFTGDNIEKGYSGSPLWDPERHCVVGMVRRGIRTSVPDTVLGVDSRTIAKFSPVRLQLDRQAKQIVQVLTAAASTSAPLRHFPLLQALMPPQLLELRVAPVRPRDLLEDDRASVGVPAVGVILRQLRDDPVVVLSGGPGTGKSTLMHSLADALLQGATEVDGARWAPVLVSATDFERRGFEIGQILDEQARRYGWDAQAVSLAETLSLNGLAPLILLDGLDELDRTARAKVLSKLSGASSAWRTARILVATRPIEDLKVTQAGRSTQGWPVFEIQHLTADDVSSLSDLFFRDDSRRGGFVDMLNTLAWDRRGPTPLQIAAAASLFKDPRWTPARPVDLTFQLVDHFLSLGADAAARQGQAARSDADIVYTKQLRFVLRRVARLSLTGDLDPASLAASGDESWLRDPVELIRYLERETLRLGGVLMVEARESGAWRAIWPHRTFAEALAAEDLAATSEFKPVQGLAAFHSCVRSDGQSLAITFLAALDQLNSASTIDLILTRVLEAGASDYNSTLLGVRSLGAGIRMNEDLRRRLVRTLIALLLLPDGARLGVQRCAELFSTDDLPNPLEIARRPILRDMIVGQLNERFSARDPRRRGRPPPLYVSEREAALLDRLSMWSDIDVPIMRRDNGSAPEAAPTQPRPRAPTPSTDAAAPAALLAYALRRLREDADGFLADFTTFVRGDGAELPPQDAGRAYVIQLVGRADKAGGPPQEG